MKSNDRKYTEKQRELLEEQRRSGKLGQQQKEWQKEQDKLIQRLWP
jgi:hypothetical protein